MPREATTNVLGVLQMVRHKCERFDVDRWAEGEVLSDTDQIVILGTPVRESDLSAIHRKRISALNGAVIDQPVSARAESLDPIPRPGPRVSRGRAQTQTGGTGILPVSVGRASLPVPQRHPQFRTLLLAIGIGTRISLA